MFFTPGEVFVLEFSKELWHKAGLTLTKLKTKNNPMFLPHGTCYSVCITAVCTAPWSKWGTSCGWPCLWQKNWGPLQCYYVECIEFFLSSLPYIDEYNYTVQITIFQCVWLKLIVNPSTTPVSYLLQSLKQMLNSCKEASWCTNFKNYYLYQFFPSA